MLGAAALVLLLAELTGVLFAGFWLADAALVGAPFAAGRLGSGFIVSTGFVVVALFVEDALLLSGAVALAVLGDAGFTFGLICTGVAVTGLVLEVLPVKGCPAWANAVPVISTTVANWIKFVFIRRTPLASPDYFCATTVGAGAVAAGAPSVLLKNVFAVQATVTLSVGA